MQEIAEPAAIEQVIAEPLGLPSASFVAALGAARKAESEIPGTPTLGTELASSEPLTAESKIEQAASSIVMLPLASLIAWADQPRREFRQDTLEELAKSIHVKGLKQNLTGRPLENGLTEVVIGGRRLRAMNLNAKQGLIDPATYLVPVHVEPLTDLEALEIATLENIEREDMTPLEEADAYARMVELGASPDDIALKMSKSVKTVQQRLTLASGLGDDGRKLYQQGKIGLSQAQVIAQTSGPLRKHVVDAAERGQNAAKLTDLIKQQAFLVEHAKFDVAQSGLEIIPDLYGHTPERFADPKAALAKQLDWVKSRQAALEKGKKQYFVEVLKTDSAYLSLPYSIYTEYNTPKDLQGTVIMVSTVTGEVKEYRCARDADIKSARAKEQAAERKQKTEQATGGEEGGAIRKSAFVDGHKARASALRHALLGDHQRTLALGILALLGSTPIPLRVTYQDVQHAPNPDSMDRLQALDRKLGGALQVDSNRTRGLPLALHHSYDPEGKAEYALLEKLLTLTLEELLELHGILITLAVGGWSEYNPQHAPYSFVTRLAADVNAKVTVKLSDEHLKAYPKDRLLELAKDAGLDYIASNAAKYPTNTALRGAILEMADELHALGYVPPICRFPEPDQAALEQERADQQYREQAKALIPTLTDEQVKELAADVWEIDAAERESVESLRSDLIDEINDLDIDDLREWEVLAKFMPQSTAAD